MLNQLTTTVRRHAAALLDHRLEPRLLDDARPDDPVLARQSEIGMLRGVTVAAADVSECACPQAPSLCLALPGASRVAVKDRPLFVRVIAFARAAGSATRAGDDTAPAGRLLRARLALDAHQHAHARAAPD